MSSRHRFWFRTEDKLGVSELSHFRNIQTRHLRLRRDPVPDENLERPVQDEAEGEDEAQQSGNTDELSGELACIAVKQARYRPRYAVPASAVVARAIGKQDARGYAT